MNLFLKCQNITVAVVVDVGWMGVKCKLWVQMGAAMSCSPIYTILLVVIYSSKEKSMVLL